MFIQYLPSVTKPLFSAIKVIFVNYKWIGVETQFIKGCKIPIFHRERMGLKEQEGGRENEKERQS